ncbi:hypothetical protein A2899_00755 [Candidatus Amesbacteria bacterium RIFCSPLOWO2_01_FULL_49_25]|uniref:DUF2795 domain-containing protein n=1 Tax=Candidatus Amesbacteria bacterium RIFCSPHIGHO2_01_FULL_48_32b TaxID=1797253 RepID=A0A1F4YCZ7_9BACT|nr:MAG: hypothetical protein A2876_01490 [Candidatus Amesbacteria bacterium RIFCSPHIGHO2_01_FULL_48_32b]OGD08037.1 MAG: hypothetical protein A2899_00755 [Candidatus Amesbacteria bacterium RIFCSPLOWO2_01_FULL_49_25]
MNKAGAIDHLKKHQTYPATRAQLLAECDGLSDFSPEDKAEFSKALPEGTYANADMVIKALGW